MRCAAHGQIVVESREVWSIYGGTSMRAADDSIRSTPCLTKLAYPIFPRKKVVPAPLLTAFIVIIRVVQEKRSVGVVEDRHHVCN